RVPRGFPARGVSLSRHSVSEGGFPLRNAPEIRCALVAIDQIHLPRLIAANRHWGVLFERRTRGAYGLVVHRPFERCRCHSIRQMIVDDLDGSELILSPVF